MSLIFEKKKIEFQNSILKWYADNVVNYPWRKNKTPYSVLISEFLLIRTRTSQVEAVFERFMKKFPTLSKFLKMEIDVVEEIIKPAGLLFRVKFLKDIAEQIIINFNNKVPDNFIDLKSLKGIGDYTANAILCFGYHQKRNHF